MPPPRIVGEGTVTLVIAQTQNTKQPKPTRDRTVCSCECAYDYANSSIICRLILHACTIIYHSSDVVCFLDSEVWSTSDVTRIGA